MRLIVPDADRGTDPEEHRLAERLRSGDPDALRDVYDRYGRATFGLLLRALGDRALAEDVQQQVFLEVWQRASSYDPARSGLLTWIMMIARSRAVDQLRRRVPEPRDPTGDTGVLAASDVSVEAEVDTLAERWQIAALLRRLPDAEADVLRQRFYAGLSQSEIAQRSGVPLGTVKSRMVSGLRRMRTMLDEEGGR